MCGCGGWPPSSLGILFLPDLILSLYNTLIFRYAFGVLRRFLPEEKVESVKGLTLTADGNGVVFDVAAEDLDTFLAGT